MGFFDSIRSTIISTVPKIITNTATNTVTNTNNLNNKIVDAGVGIFADNTPKLITNAITNANNLNNKIVDVGIGIFKDDAQNKTTENKPVANTDTGIFADTTQNKTQNPNQTLFDQVDDFLVQANNNPNAIKDTGTDKVDPNVFDIPILNDKKNQNALTAVNPQIIPVDVPDELKSTAELDLEFVVNQIKGKKAVINEALGSNAYSNEEKAQIGALGKQFDDQQKIYEAQLAAVKINRKPQQPILEIPAQLKTSTEMVVEAELQKYKGQLSQLKLLEASVVNNEVAQVQLLEAKKALVQKIQDGTEKLGFLRNNNPNVNPYGNQYNSNPYANQFNPYANQYNSNPYANQFNPYANQYNSNPYANQYNNPYGNQYNSNPYANQYNSNPYGNQYNSNPYANQYNSNPYGNQYNSMNNPMNMNPIIGQGNQIFQEVDQFVNLAMGGFFYQG